MSLPGANFNILNGQSGSVVVGDYGIFGLILSGVAIADKIALLEPKQIFDLDDIVNWGIDAQYDSDNSVDVYRQIKEFYDEAGIGAELWLMLVSPTVTLASMSDKSEANYAVKLLTKAKRKIRLLGFSRTPDATYEPVITEGLDPDVFSALITANALAEEYADNNNPIRTIIEGRAFDGTTADLPDLKLDDKNRTSIMIGGSKNDGSCSIGLLMGRLAADPIKRSPGRTRTGALVLESAYIGSEDVEDIETKVGAIHDKGYITIREVPTKAGFFFSDSPTATGDDDDYPTLPQGRVIDAVHIRSFAKYMDEVLDEINVDDNGYLSPAYVKDLESTIEDAVNGDLSDQYSKFDLTLDPKQNIISSPKVKVKMSVTPVGYAKAFEVELGINNPYSA